MAPKTNRLILLCIVELFLLLVLSALYVSYSIVQDRIVEEWRIQSLAVDDLKLKRIHDDLAMRSQKVDLLLIGFASAAIALAVTTVRILRALYNQPDVSTGRPVETSENDDDKTATLEKHD